MQDVKGPPTDFIFDLVNPNMEMLTRNGDVPCFAIIATHTEFSPHVGVAQTRVMEALAKIMTAPEDNLLLMRQDRIEMESGEIMTLTEHSLVMSLQYDTHEAKLMHIELADTQKVTIH